MKQSRKSLPAPTQGRYDDRRLLAESLETIAEAAALDAKKPKKKKTYARRDMRAKA